MAAADSSLALGDRARLVDVADHVDVYEFMQERGLTDGLPVVPPTRERVDRMLAGTSRAPREVIAEIPPNYAPATVEKAAINAVMAGAKPEYFPVILAAIEAAAGPGYGLHGSTATTAGAAPAIIVNGPIRDEIGMNSGLNALGQGNRANSTIGRALRLVVRNVGGAKPGGVEQSIQGGGHKWNLTFAEREEASPWEPLHVELGFDAADSALSMMALLGGPRVCIDQTSRTARQLAGSLALASQAIFDPKRPAPMCMFVVAPEHADVFAADGWSKNDVRECIIEDTQLPLRERLSNDQAGAGIADYIAARRGWSDAELDQPMPKFAAPEDIVLVVAGSTAGKWTSLYPGFGGSLALVRPWKPAAARITR